MPVTIDTANLTANSFPGFSPYPNAIDFFQNDNSFSNRASELLSSNFNPNDNLRYSSNGFVHTVIEAYSNHYHLVIRPDDVWISILSQLSFYINAHAEELRANFVTHEGKEELKLFIPPTPLNGINWDAAGDGMIALMNEHIVDKELSVWITPTFSTTTRADKTVSAMMMMACLKEYFEYTFIMLCGIPSVTLDGQKEDWVDILSRIEKLSSWGEEPAAWSSLLKPVIKKFIAAFDEEVDVDFWGHIASPRFFGSGSHTLGGWITAFCAFTWKGKYNGDADVINYSHVYHDERYVLDGVRYPIINKEDIPPGGAEVDIKIVDSYGTEYESLLITGNLGLKVTRGSTGDTVQNVPIWACCLRKSEKELRKQEEIRQQRFRMFG
jgi:hypothetical protein